MLCIQNFGIGLQVSFIRYGQFVDLARALCCGRALLGRGMTVPQIDCRVNPPDEAFTYRFAPADLLEPRFDFRFSLRNTSAQLAQSFTGEAGRFREVRRWWLGPGVNGPCIF